MSVQGIRRVIAPIVRNGCIKGKIHLLEFFSPSLAEKASPGQFFHIRVAERVDIFLRRPFSVCDVKEDRISILYKVVGKGTAVLSKTPVGAPLDILGPLGKGFTIETIYPRVTLIAGGIGIAPLYFLAKQLKKNGKELKIFFGASSTEEIVLVDELKSYSDAYYISTDDGSIGEKGVITDLIRKQIPELKGSYVYACGPKKMLEELKGILLREEISGEFSLEAHMGCGVGVCLGCVVETVDGLKRVCSDGPVFDYRKIVWKYQI